MATITPSQDIPQSGVQIVTWAGVATGDTVTSQELGGSQSIAGAVQMTGTWGGATNVLQVSNDNTNWFTLKDTSGSDISFTANGWAEFSTAARYIRVAPSGGTGDSVTVLVSLRG